MERERAGDGRKASSVCRIWIHFEVDRTFPDLSKKRISDSLPLPKVILPPGDGSDGNVAYDGGGDDDGRRCIGD